MPGLLTERIREGQKRKGLLDIWKGLLTGFNNNPDNKALFSDKTLYDKSDIYKSIKDAYTAPGRALRGEIGQPWADEDGNIHSGQEQTVYEAMNTAGMAQLGGIPGGARGPGSVGMIKSIGNMPKKGVYPKGITADMVQTGKPEEMFGESMAATIRKMNNGDYLGRYIPAWGGEGKPFYAIGDDLPELKNAMLARMGKSELGTKSAKDAKFNNSLLGQLQNEFGDTFKTGKSTQSNSQYFTHEPSGLKVRVSDHDLPLGYEQPDIDLRSSMTVSEQLAAIKQALIGEQPGKANNLIGLPPAAPMRPRNALGQEIPPTQYELAQEAARVDAWKNHGLPENNTAMDRASAMGRDMDVYHGTRTEGLEALDPDIAKYAREGAGTWLTPNTERANSYAGTLGGYVMPLKIDPRDMARMDFEGRNWASAPEKQPIFNATGKKSYPSRFFDDPYDLTSNDYSVMAKARGNSGIIIDNVKDAGGYGAGVNASNMPEAGTSIALHDPRKARSRFAAFNMSNRDSADLLAGLYPYAMPAATAGLLGSMYPYEDR